MTAPVSRVLVVDDNDIDRELIVERVSELGHDVREAPDGIAALEALKESEPDLILLDVDMADRETRLAGLAAGADDFLTKPFDGQELLVRTRVLLRERQLNKRLDAAEAVIFALARAVEARDMYTVHHAERVGSVARALAETLGLDPEEQHAYYEGGVPHDLGKIGIPDAVLLKAGPLDEREWEIMRSHPGDAIPLAARVAAVADGWDAMTSDRAYRPRFSHDEALRRLKAGAGSQWDSPVVDAFLRIFANGTPAAVTAHASLEDR